MSLAPDLQDIYGSYEFCEEERRHLIDYYTETKKQLERELSHDDADWNKTILLGKELSEDAKDFTCEVNDYTIAWKYSNADLIDMIKDLLKELKK